MDTKEEILKEFDDNKNKEDYQIERVKLEILLDIREALSYLIELNKR